MSITEPDSQAGGPHRQIAAGNSGRYPTLIHSDLSPISDAYPFSIATDPISRPNSSLGPRSNDNFRSPMGPSTSITAAAAAAQAQGNWPGGLIRDTEIRVDSQELVGLEAELRRRTKYVPREDSRWVRGDEYAALRELARFLRDVTPPPGNFMSIPTPSSPSTAAPPPSILLSSSASSLKRPRSVRRVSMLKKYIGVLVRRKNGRKKLVKKRTARSPSPTLPLPTPSSPSPRPRPQSQLPPPLPPSSSSPPSRSASGRRKKRPPRIWLPDSAIAGTTVDGFRHIGISIPIEHAHLGPEPEYRFPKPDRRQRALSLSETGSRIYHDVNVRPMSAFVSEPHIGTQLGPVVEERESLSSKSPLWDKSGSGSASSIGGGGGGMQSPIEVRRVRLVSRNTFGTVNEESGSSGGGSCSASGSTSRPATHASNTPLEPRTPQEYQQQQKQQHPQHQQNVDHDLRPSTPYTSEDTRKSARQQALAALTAGLPEPSPVHSFNSFASASPGDSPKKVFYPKRNSSLKPSEYTPPKGDRGSTSSSTKRHSGRSDMDTQFGRGRGRGRVGQQSQQQQQQQQQYHHYILHSRDSSRDQYTLQESIFSEKSYPESSYTIESSDAAPGPVISRAVIREAMPARRVEEGEIVISETSSRSSGERSRKRNSMPARKRDIGKEASGDKGKERRRRSAEGSVTATWGSSRAVRRSFQNRDEDQQSAMSAQARQSILVESIFEDFGPFEGQEESEEAVFKKELGGSEQAPATQEQEDDGRGSMQRPTGDVLFRSEGTRESLMDISLLVPEEILQPKNKGKEVERITDPVQGVQKSTASTVLEEEIQEDTTPSPVSSHKERNDRKGRGKIPTILLTRKHRVAELRRALESPGSRPQDLVWERRLSSSSEDSNRLTPTARITEDRKVIKSPRIVRLVGATPPPPLTPTPTPAHLTITPVRVVVEVRPSSPVASIMEESEGIILNNNNKNNDNNNENENDKESATLALTSPTTTTVNTINTVIKTSPVQPYRSLDSVTPPDSPAGSVGSRSPDSTPSQFSAAVHESQSTPLRSPLKRLSFIRRHASIIGRSSASASALASAHSSSPRREDSPARPKTAGKGLVASRRDFFGGLSKSISSSLRTNEEITPATPAAAAGGAGDGDGAGAGAGAGADTGAGAAAINTSSPTSAAVGNGGDPSKPKSALRMTRSELFDRYEALRDRQAREVERRLNRVEKYGDYWLMSMMPLLTDLSQTLGTLALGNMKRDHGGSSGKGKEAVHERDDFGSDIRARPSTAAGYGDGDGRKSRFGNRSTPAVDEVGESIATSHHQFSSSELGVPSSSSPASFGQDESFTRRERRATIMGAPRRVYLFDEETASHHPGIGYRVPMYTDEEERRGRYRAGSLGRPPTLRHYGRSQSTPPKRDLPPRQQQPQQQQQQQQQQQGLSGSTTVVDNNNNNNNIQWANSLATMSSGVGSSGTPNRAHQKRKTAVIKPPYALHPNMPLPLHAEVAAEMERLAQIERVNEHIDARMRSMSFVGSSGGSSGGGGGGPMLGPIGSEESLETYKGTLDDSEEEETKGKKEQGDDRRWWYYPRPTGSGMDTVTPLMREIQASGTRLSMESLGGSEGDSEVRRLRRGPEPRALVGFEAFSRRGFVE